MRFGLTIFLCLVLLPKAVANPTVSVAVGDPLRTALDRFGEAGLNVVSTTQTIPNHFTVTRLPDSMDDLATQVRWLLAPYKLELVLVDASNGFVKQRSEEVAEASQKLPAVERDSIIEEVVVTSHYHVRRNPTTATALGHRDLQSLPSLGRDALRGLQVLPGLASSGLSARHRFRGGDDNETLYRLDGIELLAPFHLPSVQSLFSAINLNVIEAADVYVAGFPVSMGARMSGAVDLVPVEPLGDFAGGIDLNQVNASFDARGQQADLSWLVSARHSLLEHSLALFDTDYGEPRFHDEFVRLVHDNDNRTIVAGFLRTTDRLTAFDDETNEEGRSRYQAAWLLWTHNHSQRLSSDWRISSISIDFNRTGEVDIPNLSVGTLRERRDFHTYEIENDWQWNMSDRYELQAGWSIATQEGNFKVLSNVTYGPLAAPLHADQDISIATRIGRDGESTVAYLSLITQLTDALKLETGVRYDGQDIDPVHVNELSARATLEYQPSINWQFSLNVGRYTQQQHLYEIQVDDGKAELDSPQHSDQVNATVTWQPVESTRIRADVYYRDIQKPWSRFDNLYNRWVLMPELQGDRIEVTPTGGRVQGAELGFEFRPGLQLAISGSYSYGLAQEYYLGKYRDRPWQQTHAFKLGFSWQSERWRVGLSGVYRSGWPTTDFVATTDALRREAYEERLPHYLSIDAHVSRLFQLPAGHLELYLDVVNFTDHDNIGGYDYTQSAARDAQGLLPIFPTLGLEWRW